MNFILAPYVWSNLPTEFDRASNQNMKTYVCHITRGARNKLDDIPILIIKTLPNKM